ncbi:hypothetical protein ACJ41O_009004 [Fusarium nematophilum]
MSLPLYKLTATQVLELLKNNTITVETYARSLLDRIDEHPAFILSQARALDQIPPSQRGPLHGLAIGIKDIMNTKGKTTTTEFAITNSGPETTNPHDPNRTPGGSSCGSAAAVADLQVPVSLGSQTGGSIIRPASFTGIFAMKPTYNAISAEGQKGVAPSFDTIGFFARSVDDLQLLADIFGLRDDETPKDKSLEEVSIALIKTPMWSSAGPGTVSALKDAATILRNSGVKVQEVSFPPEVAHVQTLERIQRVITLGEAQVSCLREYRMDKANLADEIHDIVEGNSNGSRKERIEGSGMYSNMRRIINDLAKNYTAILTPSAVDEAPLGLDDMGSAVFNTMWTASISGVFFPPHLL